MRCVCWPRVLALNERFCAVAKVVQEGGSVCGCGGVVLLIDGVGARGCGGPCRQSSAGRVGQDLAEERHPLLAPVDAVEGDVSAVHVVLDALDVSLMARPNFLVEVGGRALS